MPISQIVIKVDRETLQLFRAACAMQGTTPTREMRRYIQAYAATWKEVLQEAAARHTSGETHGD